jgi:hypothetical protein
MIFGATDDQCCAFVFSGDAAKKGPKVGLNVRFDQIATQLRREDAGIGKTSGQQIAFPVVGIRSAIQVSLRDTTG